MSSCDDVSENDDAARVAERRQVMRELEIARLALLGAMASCGIAAPARASVAELLDLLDRRALERLRRLNHQRGEA